MSKSESFNLIDRPWIPVRDFAGDIREVSLREFFHAACYVQDLAAETEAMRHAIFRAIAAVFYRAFDTGFTEGDDRVTFARDILETGGKGKVLGVIDSYLDEFYDRFDLLHPVTPFMQVPDLRTAKGEWKSLEILVPDYRKEDSPFGMLTGKVELSLAQAARYLIFTNAYDISGIKSGAVGDSRVKGGKGYPMGIGWAGYLGGTIISGSNMWETLVLNYVPGFNREKTIGDGESLPIWEEPPLTAAERENPVIGPVALLTWPQRRFRLLVEDGICKGVLVANGDPAQLENLAIVEPFTCWRFDKYSSKPGKLVYKPQKLSAGKSLWQGLNTLFPTSRSAAADPEVVKKFNIHEVFIPSETLRWIGELRERGVLQPDKLLQVSVVSMVYGTQMAKFDNEVSDRLAITANLADLQGSSLIHYAHTAVQRALEAGRALRYFAHDLQIASGLSPAVTGDELQRRLEIAEGNFFASVDLAFREWIVSLRHGIDVEEKLAEITNTLRESAEAVKRELLLQVGPDAWAGRTIEKNKVEKLVSVGEAEAKYRWLIRKALSADTALQGEKEE